MYNPVVTKALINRNSNFTIDSQSKQAQQIAWIFPGQGSQKLGMGLDLLAYSVARARFRQAQQILGWSILEMSQNKDKLSCTLYTQPCIYVIEALLVELMKNEGYQPDLVAGYSLGEYAAMYAAGAFDFETGLYLIKHRAEIMNRTPRGRMVALIGFEPEKLKQTLLHTANVWRANDSLTLAIISGTSEAVASLLTKVEAKRVIPINVSGAFHTPLMEVAAQEFRQILESTPFSQLKVPVLTSTELTPTVDIDRVKSSLIRQISQPVKWRAISMSLAKQDIKEVVEISQGKDLLKQTQRICPELTYTNVSTLITVKNESLVDTLARKASKILSTPHLSRTVNA